MSQKEFLKYSQTFYRYARFFCYKTGLNFYKRKPEEWKQIQNDELKKKRLFADLFQDDDEPKQNKKKQKK